MSKKYATALFAGLFVSASMALAGTSPGTENGTWHYLGGDAAHTRYSPANQVKPGNLEDLEEAWVWDGATLGARSGRSTPS